MTKDELRKHCERICERYVGAYGCFDKIDKIYEEHKLVLDLLNTDDVLTKALVIKALEDVKAEIETLFDGDVCAKEHNCDKDVLDIIDRKIAEVTKDCISCTHSDELDGEYCYECVKGDRDNFEAVGGEA